MEPAAIAIVFCDQKRKILLVERRDTPIWVLPGGGIDEGEDAEQAVIREVLEETGLDVSVKRAIAHYSPTNKLGSHTYTFECTVVGGRATTSNETKCIGFFEIDHPPGVIFPPHRQWIRDALLFLPERIEGRLTGTSYLAAFLFLFRHPLISIRYLATSRFWKRFSKSHAESQ